MSYIYEPIHLPNDLTFKNVRGRLHFYAPLALLSGCAYALLGGADASLIALRMMREYALHRLLYIPTLKLECLPLPGYCPSLDIRSMGFGDFGHLLNYYPFE